MSAGDANREALSKPLKAVAAAVLFAASVLALGLMLIPGIAWRHPAVDQVYAGFDPNLIYTDPTGQGSVAGTIQVSPRSLQMVAVRQSMPTATLATTPLQRFTASMDVVISSRGAGAFRVGIMSATAGAGAFLAFGGAPGYPVEVVTVQRAGVRQTLIGGELQVRARLASYAPGRPYHVEFVVDKVAGVIAAASADQHIRLTTAEIPDLLRSVRLSLNASVLPVMDPMSAGITNYALTLPHDWSGPNKVGDFRTRALVLVCLVLGGLALASQAYRVRWARIAYLGDILRWVRRTIRRLPWKTLAIVVLLVGGLVLVNVASFGLGNHPYDMLAEKIWGYTAAQYGPDQLYYRPGTVSMATITAGSPYHDASFAYEPTLAYVFLAAGWIGRWFGSITLNGSALEYVIKTINLLFILADGALIYSILRVFRLSPRTSLLGAALFVLNPIVWFSASVWGTTQVISAFFLFAAILAAEREQPTLAWLALALGALTRPQMLVATLVLAIVFGRRFSLRRSAVGIALAAVIVFLFLTPFSVKIAPSLPSDFMLHVLGFVTTTNDTSVSAQAASIWPLATLVLAHQHGLARMIFPAATQLGGGVSYGTAGLLLLASAVAIAIGRMLSRGVSTAAAYLPALAFAMMALVMFQTGITATHFVLVLAVLVLCMKVFGRLLYATAIGVLTITTFVMMVGSVEVALLYGHYESFPIHPGHSVLARALLQLSVNDLALTVGVLLNLAVLIALLLACLFPLRGSERVRPGPG